MTQSIMQLLITCETLLRNVNEMFWANKLLQVIEAIQGEKKPEIVLMKEVLSLYGGMGSFNDLILSEHNDHCIKGLDEGELNDELSVLRNEIYRYARSVVDD